MKQYTPQNIWKIYVYLHPKDPLCSNLSIREFILTH